MSASHIPSSFHERTPLFWGIFLLASLVGLFCGTWGYWLYEQEHAGHAAWLSAAYHTLQLFFLHMPSLDGRINAPLEIGRWSAVLATSLAFILFLLRIIRIEWGAVRQRLTRRHTIVCGLGETGIRIATEFKLAKERVVAIEQSPYSLGVQLAENAGIPVIIGDAKQPRTLKAAGVARASRVLAVCTDDDTNLAIAGTLKGLAQANELGKHTLECLILIENPRLRNNVQKHLKACAPATEHLKLNVGGLDIPDVVAREAFRTCPLDFEGIPETSPDRVHLILIGTCDLAFALAAKALQLCHFANGSRLRLTWLGASAAEQVRKLRALHPHGQPWYDAEDGKLGPATAPLPDSILNSVEPHERLTVAVCPQAGEASPDDTESTNMLLGLSVAAQLEEFAKGHVNRPAHRQVLIRLNHKRGFCNLLDAEQKPPTAGTRIRPFGLAENFCSPDVLLNERQDRMAREFQERFRKQYGEDPWDELIEDMRNSNRQAADHIPIKLRAIGLNVALKKPPKEPIPNLFPKETGDESDRKKLELLSRMEHARWCAERYLAGWEFGTPIDNDEKIRLKINKFLVPWNDLGDNDKGKDLAQVNAIPEVLNMAGYTICKSGDGT